MTSRSIRWLMGVFVLGLVSVLPGLGAGETAPAATKTAQVTVTVHARKRGVYPVVNPDDIKVYENNQKRPVGSWVAAKAISQPLDLTILFDDSIKARVSLQFRDIANFLPTLPAGTRVRIAYAAYGGNQVAQDFTTNYALAAKSLRLPVGSMMAGGSIYESVADLLKKWPQDGNRRAVLLISDGIDINEGLEESQYWLNIELQRAIDLAQSTNVPIYTIFARGNNGLERNWFLLDNGQNCLSRLASETGGEAYFQVNNTPLDFTPYLKQFANDLDHQYLLTFQPLPTGVRGYQPLRVATEVPGVKLAAPARILIPSAG